MSLTHFPGEKCQSPNVCFILKADGQSYNKVFGYRPEAESFLIYFNFNDSTKYRRSGRSEACLSDFMAIDLGLMLMGQGEVLVWQMLLHQDLALNQFLQFSSVQFPGLFPQLRQIFLGTMDVTQHGF